MWSWLQQHAVLIYEHNTAMLTNTCKHQPQTTDKITEPYQMNEHTWASVLCCYVTKIYLDFL
jgi:hypothetical protein